ncbi:hypothetical protein N658DRAFT_561822 [Parathielavia hyrcaniae]|uniref:Uncharacterized protein n=1 Tax=Parathielavia hyrcaniae TaxID=113614 RepID=A0AAN6PT09_9PEZI|nr:hypothetical protein N658DRAFT_561822 [Parathielavia hyrcaniae]
MGLIRDMARNVQGLRNFNGGSQSRARRRLSARCRRPPLHLARRTQRHPGPPTPREEDRLCVAKTGLTRAGLVAKAVAQPGEFTLCEAKIICHHRGVNHDDNAEETAWARLEESMRRKKERQEPTPLEKLYNEALARLCAVRSPEETTTLTNALNRQSEIEKAASEANEMMWREHERARIVKVGTPWIKQMLKAGLLEDGAECWGFVVFRTGCLPSKPLLRPELHLRAQRQ